VRELLGKLSALDHSAESAVRVIAYFDALIDGHAGLDALVRGAAVLSGCPAGLHDAERHLAIRIDPDGRRLESTSGPARPEWPGAALDGAGARVWLERDGSPLELDAMIVERLAAGVRVVLDRTRGRAASRDPALVEVLVDRHADADTRAGAARRLGLAAGSSARVVASTPISTPDGTPGGTPPGTLGSASGGALGGTPRGTLGGALAGPPHDLPAVLRRRHTVLGQVDLSVVPHSADWTSDPAPGRRFGIGPQTPVEELPGSWEGALVALRLTAGGTALDPGPRQLRYEELGGLALLATSVPAAAARIPDVAALEKLGGQVPWALATLDAIAEHASLRRAAASLHVHHSTLQERVAQLARVLGYPLDTAAGHNRLYLALVLRRLHRNGDLPPSGG
jgi:hypothetical protein